MLRWLSENLTIFDMKSVYITNQQYFFEVKANGNEFEEKSDEKVQPIIALSTVKNPNKTELLS